jgi:hypothetical protein
MKMAIFKAGMKVKLVRCRNPRLTQFMGQEVVLFGSKEVTQKNDPVWIMPFTLNGRRVRWGEVSMEPAVSPHESAWQQFKADHLTPERVLA